LSPNKRAATSAKLDPCTMASTTATSTPGDQRASQDSLARVSAAMPPTSSTAFAVPLIAFTAAERVPMNAA